MHTDIKDVPQTCIGTKVPSPGSTVCQVQYQLPTINYYLQGSTVCNRTFATARLLKLWVRIPPGTWMFVCCECCLLSGRGLCDELITRPEVSRSVWSKNLVNEEPLAHWWLSCQKQTNKQSVIVSVLMPVTYKKYQLYNCFKNLWLKYDKTFLW